MNKEELFLQAINSNTGSLYKIASIYTDDVEDRNDLIQEIIYQLWKSVDSFSGKSGLSTWMYRVSMNVAIHHLKASKRRVPTVAIDEHSLNFQEFDKSDDDHKWKLLKQYVDNLNLLEKGIVILYLEEKSYEEIAEIVGISVSNVGTKLSRIKEKIRNQINKKLQYGTG